MQFLFRLSDWVRHRARLRAGNAAHAWGRRGEDLAHRYLRAKSYTVVARNFRNRGGSAEVDLIARDGETVVFVEVKTRATERFGAPEQAVDAEKRRKLIRGAAEYLRRAELTWDDVRFDIVTVLLEHGERIEHIRDAFRPPAPL